MITESIPLTNGVINRTVTVKSVNAGKKSSHPLATRTLEYDTPEGAATVVETADYVPTVNTSPPPVPTPVPTPVPKPSGIVLWDGRHLAGWGNQSAVLSGPNARIKEVADPAGGSAVCLQMTTLNTDTDKPTVSGTVATPTENPRSQLVSPSNILLAGQTYWKSSKLWIPEDSPLAKATSWVALETPAYGFPFTESGPIGVSIDYIASDSLVGPDGAYLAWEGNAHHNPPWGYVWDEGVPLAEWIKITWHFMMATDGAATLYINDNEMGTISTGALDASDYQGPWTSRLMLYYAFNQFPQATVLHKDFLIGTTMAAAEGS